MGRNRWNFHVFLVLLANIFFVPNSAFYIENWSFFLRKSPTYHREAVLKEEFPDEKNSIFVISVVNYPRPRQDPERVPLHPSKNFFYKNQCKKGYTEQKKRNDSHWIRTSVASYMLFSHSAICELFLFCSVSNTIFILLFNLNSTEWIFKYNIIIYHYKTGSSNSHIRISFIQNFSLSQYVFISRKKII